MKKLFLILLTASCAFAQNLPLKSDSSGNITEPTTYLGQNMSFNGVPQFTSLNLSPFSGTGSTFLNMINGNSGWTWTFLVNNAGAATPGAWELDDNTDGLAVLRFLKTTGQPIFPTLATDGVVVTSATGAETVIAKGSNNTFFGVNGSGVKGFYAASGTISGLNTNAFVYGNSATSIASTAAATNGQILIGSTGNPPVAGSVTGTANQITSTPGAGSITLSLPAAISTGAGTTGTNTATFVENGGSGTGGGAYYAFQRNGVTLGSIGTESAILGDASSNYMIYSNANNPIVFWVNGSQVGSFTSTGLNTLSIASNGDASFSGKAVSSGATSGIGYAVGAGGTITQVTSRTTGVTLNTVSGAITLVSAAGQATYQSFTVSDTAVAATDTISVNQKSGTDLNIVLVTAVSAGSFKISFATTGGTTTEQPVFQFNVIKGSNT